MLKKSWLKKLGSSDVSKCKQRIQKLLTAIVRAKDGGCIFRNYPQTGACSGYTAADHIISRQFSATYGDTRNVICLCTRHHIYWKPQNPTLYVEIVKDYLGAKTWDWIERAQRDRKTYSFQLNDWLKIEIGLKKELADLENAKG